MTEKNRPVQEFRIGSIRAACWKNNSTGGRAWYSVTLSRRYREKEGGEWRDSNTFSGLADLAHVKLAVELAMDWLATHDTFANAGEE